MIEQELEKLLAAAKNSPSLKEQLLETKATDEPVADFCKLCQNLGYDVSIGELLACGMTSNDAKLRSVNGGGVNSIDGWDDTYEQFFLALEAAAT